MNFRTARLRTPKLASLALLLCSTAAIPFAAHAQETDDEDTAEAPDDQRGSLDDINTIVVTGTKTQNAENVQDVPLAVTAFNAASLEALKVRDVQSLTYSAPNVSLDQIGTSRGTANFSIRGLGINSSIPSIDPTVGVFVDGVYLGFNGGVVFDLFDLESVEILRGPQGILFGRNTTGGAVLINTGNPTNDFRGKFRVAVDGPVDSGRGGANYTASSVLSGPIVEDVLLFKVGAYYNNDEGYFRNLFDGSNHGAAETTILRGALEARLGDLTVTGKLDYFTSNGDGPSGQNRGRFSRDTFDISIDEPGFYDNEIWTGSLTSELDIGPGTLTNIFGYRKYSATTLGDIDSLPIFGFHSATATEQEQISNELRYAISTDNFDLTVGGFYFDQSIAYDESRELQRFLPPEDQPPVFYGGGQQDHQVLGVFAAGQFYLTDRFSIIAGIRWSREEKDAGVTYIRPRPECSVVGGTCPTSGTNPFFPAIPPSEGNPGRPAENNGFTDGTSWSNWSPKLGFQYEFDNSQIYAHWTRGYRSGGYNFRITNATVFENVVVPATGGNLFFDEERVDNYELGGKFQTADGSFTLNAAIYLTQIDNMQREVNQSSPTAGVSQFILNTADAEILGFEAEARARLSDSLIFTANLGLIDDKYKEVRFDISSDGVINDADLALRLPRVPEVTWGVGLIHELLLDRGAIMTRVNYQFRDEFAYTDNNFGYIQDASMLDANITWETPLDGLALSIYGRNLFDQVQAGGDTQLPFGGPLSDGNNRPFDPRPAAGTLSPLSKGRQLGAELTFEF